MTNKQAQIQMAFLIAFVSIIIIFGVLIGVRQIKQMQQNALKAETTDFVLELKSTIQEITEQYGNTRKISLKAPKSIYEICLVDEKLFENKTLLRQYCENLGLETYYFEKKYVCSIIEEDVKKNLFFFPTQQNQYVGPLSLQNPIICIPANENNFNLLVAGLGDTSIVVEVNPVQVQGCSSDDDCGDGEHCDGGVCTKDEGCTSNTDCPGEVCNTETGECVECLSDNDCESNEKCSEHVCVDLVECEYLGQKYEEGEKWCSENKLCTCNIKDHKAEVSCVECTNGCTTSSGIAICKGTTCGNNQKEDGEVCDGSDLNGKSCSNFTDDYGFSFTGGTLQCKDDCSGFDTSLCKNSNIKKYTISYNKASIACFWDRTKVESCSDFADEITEMFDTGHPGNSGFLSKWLLLKQLECEAYPGVPPRTEYFDFVIIPVHGHGVPQVNKINVKRELGLSSPISISPDLNYDHKSSDGGVVCYELCKPKHRGNGEVTLVVNTRKPELISVEKNHDCILCPVWNSKFYCVQSVFCLSPIGEVQDNKECGGDDEVCCKITPNMCPADNDQYEGCKETCSPGYIEDEGRYCPDNKKCCKESNDCDKYNTLNDGYHYMCQRVTKQVNPTRTTCQYDNLGYQYFKDGECDSGLGCCRVKTCESAGGHCSVNGADHCEIGEEKIEKVWCDTGVCCEISGGGGGGSNYRCSGSCFYRECPEDYVEISGNCPGEGRVCCKHEVHRNPTSCFPAGTLVFMADGTYKPIETVKSGDYVVSYDFKTGENVKAKVLEVEKPIRYHMYTLTFNDSSVLKLTNEHPIYVKNKGWSSINPEVTWETHHLIVNKLEVGDNIVKVNGTVVLMNISYKEYPEGIQTYNLKTILHHHNYYADGVLVHNKCPPNC